MNAALNMIGDAMSDLQKNHNRDLSLWGATVHRYSPQSLAAARAVIPKAWMPSDDERWESVGYDTTRSVQYQLPPRYTLDAKQPSSVGKRNSKALAPVLPVFYSVASARGILAFFCERHSDRLVEDGVDTVHLVLQRYRYKSVVKPELVLTSESERQARKRIAIRKDYIADSPTLGQRLDSAPVTVGLNDESADVASSSASTFVKAAHYVGCFVPCVAPLDAVTSSTATHKEQSTLNVAHVLEAFWAMRCAWADHNHFQAPATPAARKLMHDRKIEAAAGAAAAATITPPAQSPAAGHFKPRVNHTKIRLPTNHISALFRADLRGNATSRWHWEPNLAAWRLAECLASRLPCDAAMRQHESDTRVVLALTRQLRKYLVYWAQSAAPHIPVNVYNAILRHNIVTQPRIAKTAVARQSRAGSVSGSAEALAIDLALAQQHLQTRVSATCVSSASADAFQPRKETIDDTKGIGMRGHIVRHLASLCLLGKHGVSSPMSEWNTLLARPRDRFHACLVPVVGAHSREQLVLFKYLDLEADARFQPAAAMSRDFTTVALAAKFGRVHVNQQNPQHGTSTTLRWSLLPETMTDPAMFRFRVNDGELTSWDGDTEPTPFETMLWKRHQTFVVAAALEATTAHMFESLLLLLTVLRDEVLAHGVLFSLFVKQLTAWKRNSATPSADYEDKLMASRLHCMFLCNTSERETDSKTASAKSYTTQLAAVCRDTVSPIRLCQGFFDKAINAVFATSLRMIGDSAWDITERFGVRGALTLARAKDIPISQMVENTFTTLLALPNAAARTEHIGPDTRKELLALLRGARSV